MRFFLLGFLVGLATGQCLQFLEKERTNPNADTFGFKCLERSSFFCALLVALEKGGTVHSKEEREGWRSVVWRGVESGG